MHWMTWQALSISLYRLWAHDVEGGRARMESLDPERAQRGLKRPPLHQ